MKHLIRLAVVLTALLIEWHFLDTAESATDQTLASVGFILTALIALDLFRNK